MKKRRIIFRIFPFNRLSFPVLLNAWEREKLDKHFEIIIRERPFDSEPVQHITNGDVILFSFMTPHIPLIHQEIKKIKEAGAIIAGGGPHISGEQNLSFEIGFDILFLGPAELSFVQFGKDLIENSIKIPYIYEPRFQTQDNLNQFLPISKYMREIPPLEIMRGCRWNCRYCSTGMNTPSFREMDSIINFLDEISKRKLNRINYICPSAMEYQAAESTKSSIKNIENLLKITKSYELKFIEYGIFPSEIRPNSISERGLEVLKKYVSHKSITLGSQSGSNWRLKELKRAHTIKDIEESVALANNFGFLANLDFILAYPNETQNERQQTIHFIKKLNKTYRIKIHLHHFFPLSGSAYEYRFPSFLSNIERERYTMLKADGIARDGWIKNEEQVRDYFSWLETHFPKYYLKYH